MARVGPNGRRSRIPQMDHRLRRCRRKWYYANLIGYARLSDVRRSPLSAFIRIPWLAAALLLGSTLLDWIDGPIARRANQCSILGSGVDWFADMASQIVAMGMVDFPAALCIAMDRARDRNRICNCIFDFATTAPAGIRKCRRVCGTSIFSSPFSTGACPAAPIPLSEMRFGWHIRFASSRFA